MSSMLAGQGAFNWLQSAVTFGVCIYVAGCVGGFMWMMDAGEDRSLRWRAVAWVVYVSVGIAFAAGMTR